MRILVALLLVLGLVLTGCSDDTETANDGGADAVVVEAGTDAVGDIAPADDLAPGDAAEDSGAGEQAVVPDASGPDGGGD